MNPIEQLGGYEETKKHLDSCWCDEDNRVYLLEKLLGYRRQNNIFEVGDKVVVKAHPFWPEDYVICTVEQEHIGKWYMSAWRHATDEEIKAGKRLELGR